MKTVDAIAGPRVGGDPVTGIQALGLATSSAGRLCAGESFPCYACCGMIARAVVGREGWATQIWHGICCAALKSRVQEGWRSTAVRRPHGSNFASSKDTCPMLVIGPPLPVLRYLWSFSRSRQPLLRPWQFRLRKLATTPLPWSTWRYGQCTGTCAPGVGTSGYHPDHQKTHRHIRREGESHANPATYRGISRYHAVLHTPTALKRGDVPVRLPLDGSGVRGQVAHTLNDPVELPADTEQLLAHLRAACARL
jgi:hypothetical protein